MKKLLILCLCLLLGACTTTASKEPILQSTDGPKTISVLNGFADEFTTTQFGITIFGNQVIKRETPAWDIPEYISTGVADVFSQVNGTTIKNLALTEQEQGKLLYRDDSQVSYEKKIRSIPGILAKANTQGIDRIIIASPSIIPLHNTGFVFSGVGLWFGAGLIEPYSAINLHIIDTASGEVIGKHKISGYLEPVKLVSDLTNAEIQSVTEKYEKEKNSYEDKKGGHKLMPLNEKLGQYCANLDRYDDFSAENVTTLNNSLKNSIDYSVSQLSNIYLGTPVREIKDWRRSFKLNPKPANSCSI